MLFTLEVLEALEGDCLLLHWGSVTKPQLAIIDGGPGNNYENSLRPRLEQISQRRRLKPLPVDLTMVSHVDNDHIVGIKKLFAEMVDDQQNQNPETDRLVRVDRLWHNTFDDIIGNKLNAHFQQFSASFMADTSGKLPDKSVDAIKNAFVGQGKKADDAAHYAEDVTKVLAGHPEGRGLRVAHKALFDAGRIRGLNSPFKKTLITAELTPKPIDLAGLKIRIVGPMQPEIDALQADFDTFVKNKNLATGEAALAAYADESVPNLSSIVCLVTMGTSAAKKTMLLTGDARGDKVIAGLRQAKLLGPALDAKLHVNVLKLPHHGSDRNADPDFFKTLSADTYILSANGKHGNPDREAVEWLIASRGKTDSYTLVFTYKIADLDTRRKAESRKPWDAAKHSLTALLSDYNAKGYKFKVTESAPALIELGSEKLAW